MDFRFWVKSGHASDMIAMTEFDPFPISRELYLLASRVCHRRDVDDLFARFREETRSPALILYLRANLHDERDSDANEDVIMIKRPSFPRPCSFPSLRWLTCLAMATAFLMIANGAVAQQRYNTPDAAPEIITLRYFKWNQKSQPISDIDRLEPFHTTELKRV
jgi:hypothetical protein